MTNLKGQCILIFSRCLWIFRYFTDIDFFITLFGRCQIDHRYAIFRYQLCIFSLQLIRKQCIVIFEMPVIFRIDRNLYDFLLIQTVCRSAQFQLGTVCFHICRNIYIIIRIRPFCIKNQRTCIRCIYLCNSLSAEFFIIVPACKCIPRLTDDRSIRQLICRIRRR